MSNAASNKQKKYGVILADPPWDYRNGGNGRARAHYPLMNIVEICALPVSGLAHDSTVLILWATWPQTGGAMRVINAWGFEFVTGFPWVKLYDPPFVDLWGNYLIRPTWGTGAWVRGCSEPVFIAKRPQATPPPDLNWMGLICERMAHSRKPDDIHECAETFPGPYLELFCRRPRPGWDVWGNEVDSTLSLAAIEVLP
jgi:N6-adenosine-specific RNA methylase IME4